MDSITTFLTPLFPVTVLVALFLFVLREILEAFKKRRERTRRLQAIKKIVARELELNLGAAQSIEAIISTITPWAEDLGERKLEIKLSETGERYFQAFDEKRNLLMGRALRGVHSDSMSKYMLEVATMDATLFAKLSTAYDATMELSHVWRSLIRIVNNEDEGYLLDAFCRYARSEIDRSKTALSDLYRACVGVPLQKARLR